jgi:D-alanyl-D-alanine carboxypeptidase
MSDPDITSENPAHDAFIHFPEDDGEKKSSYISTIPVAPQLGVALGLLVFVFGITYVGATHALKEQSAKRELLMESEMSIREKESAPSTDAFEGVSLEAKSAMVWDVKNKRALFEKNSGEELPLASVTKLMTALIVYELLDADDKVAITLDALRVEGDSGFLAGEEFTVQNLSDLTLIASSNDGAAALSAHGGSVLSAGDDPEAVFVTAMNIRAEELGLMKTSFRNSTGLDISPSVAGAQGSAEDVSLLMDYIITTVPDAVSLTNLEVTTVKNENGAYHIAKNTNRDAGTINGLLASKTGYTELSGGNLVIAFNAGLDRPIVITVLGSSYNGRFADTEKLIERTRRQVSGNN